MTSFTVAPDHIKVTAASGQLCTYQFGTNKAEHLFCATCGIYPFVKTRLTPGHFRVNLGCVEGVNLRDLPVEFYEGRDL